MHLGIYTHGLHLLGRYARGMFYLQGGLFSGTFPHLLVVIFVSSPRGLGRGVTLRQKSVRLSYRKGPDDIFLLVIIMVNSLPSLSDIDYVQYLDLRSYIMEGGFMPKEHGGYCTLHKFSHVIFTSIGKPVFTKSLKLDIISFSLNSLEGQELNLCEV